MIGYRFLTIFICCFTFSMGHAQTEVYNQKALDSIYESLKSNSDPSNSYVNTFKTINYSISKIANDTIAGKYYKDFANLRLDMGFWDSIPERMFQKSYQRITLSGDYCKLVIVQFNITRFALFQDSPKTLEKANHCLEIARKCGDLKHIAHAQSFIGAAYLNLSDYKNALKNLLESEQNYTSIDDAMGIAMVNLDLAIVYSHFQENLKSIEATKKAALIYKNAGRDLNYAVSLIDMCASYLDIKELDSVVKYLPIAHDIVRNRHQMANAYVYQNYGNLYIELNDYDKAITNLKTALKINEAIDDRSLNSNLYNALVEAYEGKGELNTAYTYALKSDSVSNTIDDKYEKLKSLLTLAKTSFDVKKHQQSKDAFIEYIQLKDSILGAEKQKEITALETFYEAEKRDNLIKIQQQENDLLTTKNKAANNRNIALLISLLLLATIAYALINKFRLKTVKQETLIKVKALENDNLNQKIDYQKRELASKALHIAQKNEILIDLKEDLTTLKNDNASIPIHHLINKLHLDRQIDNNWELFTNQFIEMNPNFYKAITTNYNDLTKNDIRLIALLKMKYDSNAIASLLNISMDGVKKARYRLRKKLNLSSDENLEKHIMNF